MKDIFSQGLDYLKAIGPGKFFKLISSVPAQRLMAISRRVDHDKMVKVLRSVSLETSISLIRKNTDDALVVLLNGLEEKDLILFMTELSETQISYWQHHLSPQITVEIINLLGSPGAVKAMQVLGEQRAVKLVKAVSTADLKIMTEHFSVEDLLLISHRMPEKFILAWLKKRGISDLLYLGPVLGAENLVRSFEVMGEKAAFIMMETLTREKALELLLLFNSMKLTRKKPVILPTSQKKKANVKARKKPATSPHKKKLNKKK